MKSIPALHKDESWIHESHKLLAVTRHSAPNAVVWQVHHGVISSSFRDPVATWACADVDPTRRKNHLW